MNEQTKEKEDREDLLPDEMGEKEQEGRQDLLPGDEGQKKESKIGKEVEEVAEELDIHLAHVNLPLPVKLIALFTLVGGLSIIGSTFVDIFAFGEVSFLLYLWRLVVGLLAVFIAYGMVRKERWAIWVYGLLVLMALIGNFFFALVPAAIVFYLYLERRHFRPSFFDTIALKILGSIKRA